MKALVMTGKKKLEIDDNYKKPEVKPNEVLVHTAWAGICGTDKASVSYTHLTLPTICSV